MLRPLYHFTLDKYGFEESEVNKPWYQQSLPQSVMENQRAKIYWDIQHYVINCPSKTQINRILLFMAKKITSGLSSRGQCAILGKSNNRELYKHVKYTELRAEIKKFYLQSKEKKQLILCSTFWQVTTKL